MGGDRAGVPRTLEVLAGRGLARRTGGDLWALTDAGTRAAEAELRRRTNHDDEEPA
jgi:hypothetical protein